MNVSLSLTPPMRNILLFVKNYARQKKHSPSYREICATLGIKSTSTVGYYIKKLTAFGMLDRDARQARSIRLTRKGMIFSQSAN